MDIKELNKTQLILLTLLITFIVSIATGIITVSLMQQAPKSVPQTINNVIQRTIERVTTEPAPTPTKTATDSTESKGLFSSLGDGDAMISIYSSDEAPPVPPTTTPATPGEGPKALGQGIIISDIGLILVDSSILTDKELYKVILDKVDFDATVLKKFTNGFTILKISKKKVEEPKKVDPNTQGASVATPKVDKAQ